jgi:DNA (cytosine-5)-methyltransferase 1
LINYYNENDPKAAAWLRELIKDGHIANGIVDERSIKDVQPNDLTDFTQCHFFAGIGGWSYALRLAGWPDSRPVWTGSCPCQPFSNAGQKGGTEDKRHLWPDFFRLIRERRPPVVFGEQVASKDGLAWLDIVSADLESADYAVGAADLCAAGVGAPHIRQRLWFVAHANGADASAERQQHGGELRLQSADGGAVRTADSSSARLAGRALEPARQELAPAERSGNAGDLGNAGTISSGRNGAGFHQPEAESNSSRGPDGRFAHGPWSASEWLECIDGKWRPVEPGTCPLAHGIPARMGRLRGYGNAIVPQVAAEFVRATMDSGHGC